MKNDEERAPKEELLPDELLWSDGGHVSDIVLTALADGEQGIVPIHARAHVERCTTCTSQLGNAALLSLYTGHELAMRSEHDRVLAHASQRLPLPRLAIALGFAVAGLGLVPSLLDHSAASSLEAFTRHVPLFVKGFGTLVRRLDEPGSAAGLVLTYGAAVLLVAMGLVLARVLPKKEVPQ